MSLELYSTCISVLQNFGFPFGHHRNYQKLAKFRRNFEPWITYCVSWKRAIFLDSTILQII